MPIRWISDNVVKPAIAVYSIAKSEESSADAWAASNIAADYRLVAVDHASNDRTAEILRNAGVHVVEIDYSEMSGFRYDVARTLTLSYVPSDIDICVSQDLDEVLDLGFIETLRAEWAEHGGFDSSLVWIDCGSPGHPAWSRTLRVHARRGFEWVAPCHETLVWQGERPEHRVESAASMTHRQLPKDRSHRIDLLRLAVEENPADARMWWYLARDSYGAGLPDVALDAVHHVLDLPTGWSAERAAACRVGALVDTEQPAIDWFIQGAMEGPDEAEAWYALASHYYSTHQWRPCVDAALRGLECPQATHYLVNQDQRSFGLKTLVGMATDKMLERNSVRLACDAQ